MMADELKPCPVPWCTEVEQISFIISHWSGAACVECLTCKARGPFVGSKDEAITAWNTRPSTPPAVSDDLVGAVEALGRARNLAMKNTVAARVPECGDFGAIAQDLDWLQNELPAIIHRREQQAAEAMRERCALRLDREWPGPAASIVRSLTTEVGEGKGAQ